MSGGSPAGDLEADLRLRLSGARRVAVVGIGNEDRPRDRGGMAAARALLRLHRPGLRVFPAGTVPESVTGAVRRFRPDRVVLLDAADMGEAPGTAAVIEPGRVRSGAPSTHGLPLSAVMLFLEEDAGVPVDLLGIQPDLAAGEGPPTEAEAAGAELAAAAIERAMRYGTRHEAAAG
ncbi:MAG: hydrogenase maturation protease [Planctomycetes bacterium]|nr:hydrogenase maturation protease [Planctomycetota bacterium]